MSDNTLGPGVWLKCLADDPHRTYGWPCPLAVGRFYSIRAIAFDKGILLNEVRWAQADAGFLRVRFAPIFPSGEALYRLLLTPVPLDEDLPAVAPPPPERVR